MYSLHYKDMIEMEMVPFIPKTKEDFPPTVAVAEIVNVILNEPKTGVR